MPSRRARGQIVARVPRYSTSRTGLPRARNGRYREHSRYCGRCSASAPSNAPPPAPRPGGIVLEEDGHPAAVRLARQPRLKAQLVRGRRGNPVTVDVAVDVVGLDGVEALARTDVQAIAPGSRASAPSEPAHVDPALAGPSLQRPAEQGRGVAARRPPAPPLPGAGRQVADHPNAPAVQGAGPWPAASPARRRRRRRRTGMGPAAARWAAAAAATRAPGANGRPRHSVARAGRGARGSGPTRAVFRLGRAAPPPSAARARAGSGGRPRPRGRPPRGGDSR